MSGRAPLLVACALAAGVAAQSGGKPGPARPPAGLVRGDAKLEHLTTVRGRCIAAETKQPLAGCVVRFSGWGMSDNVLSRHGPVDWRDPEPVTTDDQGRFVVWFIPWPAYQHALDVQCAERVPRTARWGSFESGRAHDLGDIALAVGRRVTGIVVDATGSPVPRIAVAVGGLPLPLRGDMNANTVRHGVSDDQGHFAVDVPLPEGTWPLSVSAPGWTLVSPGKITVAGESTTVRVVLRAVPSITGHVFDEAGRPFGRIMIHARAGEEHVASTWTRGDGSFAVFAPQGAPDEVQLEVGDTEDCEPQKLVEPYPWGASAIRIDVLRALSFQLTVVEKGTGKPVEEYTVRCHAARSLSSVHYEARLGGRHESGVVRVDKVWRGANRITVMPTDMALAPSADLVFTAAPDTLRPMRIEVERLVPIDVRVLGATGEPSSGVLVQVLDRRESPAEVGQVSDPRGGSVPMGDPPVDLPVVISSGTTDAEGNARVYGRRDGETIARAIRTQQWILARVTLPAPPQAGERVILQNAAAK